MWPDPDGGSALDNASAPRGRLIAFEGIDGSGKSTQARLLADRLHGELTREPGGTEFGAAIREIVLSSATALGPQAEALLMLADRSHHANSYIGPLLDSGRHVVTDRFAASTLAYQGYGRGLDLGLLDSLTSWVLGELRADLNILIDLPVKESLRRANSRPGGSQADRFESEGTEFLTKVSQGFREIAASGTESWLVVDGLGSVSDIHDEICREVENRFPGIVGR